MARLNHISRPAKVTHEGAPARGFTPIAELKRVVASCFLWEDQFYEDGVAIAERIETLVGQSDPNAVSLLAREARTEMKLRHAPLWMVAAMVKHNMKPSRDTVSAVLKRADEPGELLAMLWKDGKKPIPKQVKLGIADAMNSFDRYQLAKYNGGNRAISLLDVLRLTHPVPKDEEQQGMFKAIADGTLEPAYTWEAQLSGGADKRETFTRLLTEGRLGYLALLRNLRNMVESGVDRDLVREAILARKGAHNVLPFRFIAAAQHAPSFEPELDKALIASLESTEPLPGHTLVLVDVSASMLYTKVSARSELTRMDAAATLGSMITGSRQVFTFSNDVVEVPPRLGMAGVDSIKRSQTHNGTYLGRAVESMNRLRADRLIVITDEQSHDRVPASTAGKAYMINVAAYQNGVRHGDWTRIDGFSESVLRYIKEVEGL